MPRATYVLRDGKLVEKHKAPPPSGAFHYMADIQPFTTVDGVHISSRKHLRDHERAYGIKQIGNDVPPPGREQ